MAIVNFTDYFKEEREVYAQNVSNCQVSVTFDLGTGHSESFLFPNTKDPVNLTRFIPFSAIKGSMDLRRMLNRQPPALRLVTEDEYRKYFELQAQANNLPDISSAIDKAEERRIAAQNHIPLNDAPNPVKIHEVVEDGQHLGEHKLVKPTMQVSEQDEINPKVLNICLQVHPSVPDQQKMSAAQMLAEIDGIPEMKIADWEYIQAHSYYKTVKNLARKKVAQLASEAVDDDSDKEEKKSKK